ncbi:MULTISPECIES: autotransporter domain-containing protein [Alphaproteobacteria]|uniref:Autotransporter domain-containing protein n=2 Tax=Alphaproteobacteria TaxID=28211 RepID=A0A512HJ21_9HYPH|nr:MULTISPECIES: autotransporter domain-containing protein [Alphaproteobacteria]GEO85458.1 hypothetical protein RNA01_23900 [Ciceribacter naphthalenivorans]GLR21520.1 hypothetical protein GCM10007920_13060 [Ciceribacter naphthalenivorans]GLT04376.1 hypothetical protein GCM10007926_13060 [Sphingomonas psychrolutea]
MKAARLARRMRLSSTSALALCLAGGFAGAAKADSVYWNGITNDWFVDSNWVWDGHTPNAGDFARIDTTGVVISGAGAYVGTLFLGISSTADLTIEDDLTSDSVSLGWNSGSLGTATITGAGNTWANSGAIYVGYGGDGVINILDGATVSTGEMNIASGTTSTGTVNLQDDSSLVTSGYLYVGFGGDATSGGDGHLNVLSGSDVTSANSIIANGTNTTGAALVDGTGSSWNTTGSLLVGGGGVGTLDVTNGGYVQSGTATVANLASASGSNVNVDGAGSEWSILGDLYLGSDGTGSLKITDGGGVEIGAAYLGYGVAGSGSIVVDDASLSVTDRIGVGYDGTGSLTIRNGATVNGNGAILGWNSTATGTATVTGVGSRWDNTGTLYVGNLGYGSLTVADGAIVTSTDGYVGTENGSDSELRINGAGSAWTMDGAFFVGHNTGAEGTVTVDGGGSISSLQGILGDLSGSVGTMTVTGAGSTWSATVDPAILYSGDLNVGRHGTGNLSVLNGGSVTGNRLHIANEAGSSGTAVVSGAGSNLTVTDRLSIGIEGDGELTVADGGTVSAGRIVIADDASSSGTLNIGAAAGDAATAAGVIDTDTVIFGDGDGEIVFNHTATDYVFGADVAGTGTLSFLSGITELTGDYSTFTGGLSIEGGRVSVNTDTLSVAASVLDGATLGGNGMLGNVAVASGGTVAPGNSIGTISVGDITFASGSFYAVEVDDLGNSDLIDASGTATINSGATVTVGPENGTDDGSTYTSGTVYTILSAAGGVNGTFGSVTDSFAFLDGRLTYDADNVFLTLLRNDIAFSSLAETRNQAAVGTALESFVIGDALYDAVAALGAADVPGAFDALSADIHASTKGMLIDDSHYVRDAFNARLLGGDPQGYGFWTSAFGAWARSESDGNAGSLAHSTGGFAGGADTVLADDWRLGFAGAYSRTAFDEASRDASGTSDNASLGLYGGRSLGPLGLRFGAAYTWHQISTERTVDVGSLHGRNEADYDARTAQLFGEASYDIETSLGRISPFAGLAYVHLRTDGFSETGGMTAVSADGDSYDTTYGTLGLRAQAPIALGDTKALLHGMAGWRHDFGDGVPAARLAFAGSDSFTVYGVPSARDVAVMEAGISLAVSKNALVSLSYAGQAGDGAWEQQVKGRLDVRF